MAKFEVKLPKMGESVAEATITNWLKEVGDTIALDDPIVEIATDKVDSEVPSEVAGVLVEKCFKENEVVQVGQVLAIINTEKNSSNNNAEPVLDTSPLDTATEVTQIVEKAIETVAPPSVNYASSNRFYSPLVKNIAKQEGISLEELDTINGSGKDNRLTKNDLLAYLKTKPKQVVNTPQQTSAQKQENNPPSIINTTGEYEIVEMTRMGKLIADRMLESKKTSAHVQSFIEADVTKIWNWRNKYKKEFETKEGEKLTFTPIFIEAVAKALRDFPLMNIQLKGDKIIKKKNINIGMATALDNGDLIVPVIKNADQLSLIGIAKAVNDLANRARNNKLNPEEIKDGTYTVTNVGNFGSIMGTPIINQPQVGILALGVIRKTPAVIETPEGDFIGIRMKMYLSHSYDHRVVNGALGGMFAQRVATYLENWDTNRVL